MKRPSHHLLAVTGLFLMQAGLLIAPAAAQLAATQEVEIEVAGPWSYVIDTSVTPNRIVLVAPNLSGHVFYALSGGDAFPTNTDNPIGLGGYKLDFAGFDKVNCPANPPSMVSKPYSLSGVDPNVVSKAINATSGGYAISLPMPCSYESYVDFRAKIDVKTIQPSMAETPYTTWIALHYTLTAAPTPVPLKTLLGASTGYNLTLSPSKPHPKGTPGISLVLYAPGPGQDPICDQESANTFDAIVNTFLGITNVHRQFPELYDEWGIGRLEQSHRYNANCIDHFAPSAAAMTMKVLKVKPVQNLIYSLREALGKSDFPTAKATLENLRKALASALQRPIPQLIQRELDSISKAIEQAIAGKPPKQINTDQLMALIITLVSPGRTDCHSPQVSINGAVP